MEFPNETIDAILMGGAVLVILAIIGALIALLRQTIHDGRMLNKGKVETHRIEKEAKRLQPLVKHS
ncbi:hypothetical protein [Chryseolinea lacunae]|uniref:Uncharacterized protein n=1 Tax=Chryseolinea lacunae TaxID=2801331 RepID=A0ABS1KXV5_9BACT|nr:hypothetical protein [Chryseolinea lacunae]MBL0743527.1 hypothetical protein [Chryseolinea lacunae]